MINKQNLEASIAEIEKQLAEMKEQLNSFKSNEWQPKQGDEYYWVNVLGHVLGSTVDSRKGLRHRVFKTQQDAQAYAEYVRAEEILKQQIASLNDGWTPDWTNINKDKFFIGLRKDEKTNLVTCNFLSKILPNFMYLKSRVLAEELIKTHSKELTTYLSY